MACARALMLLCMVLVSMVAIFSGEAKATISCGQVEQKLAPCLPYLKSGGKPASQCCSGVETVYNMVPTTADRRNVCNCLKNLSKTLHYNGNNVQFAAGLPAKCGVNIPYKISPSTSCNCIN